MGAILAHHHHRVTMRWCIDFFRFSPYIHMPSFIRTQCIVCWQQYSCSSLYFASLLLNAYYIQYSLYKINIWIVSFFKSLMPLLLFTIAASVPHRVRKLLIRRVIITELFVINVYVLANGLGSLSFVLLFLRIWTTCGCFWYRLYNLCWLWSDYNRIYTTHSTL